MNTLNRAKVFSFLAIGLLSLSCHQPLSRDAVNGGKTNLRIMVSGMEGRTVLPAMPTVASYSLFASAGSEYTLVADFTSSTATALIAQGTYNFRLDAKDSSGNAVLSQVFENIAVGATTVNLAFTLSPVNGGYGNVSVAVTWPAGIPVERVETLFGMLGATMTTANASINNYSVSYTVNGIANGNYFLTFRLLDSGNGLLASVTEGIRVYQNLTSSKTINLTTSDFNAPLAAWTGVAAGLNFSLGVKADGTLWAWGANGIGQLGQGVGDTAPRYVPTRVGNDSDWSSVTARDNSGSAHALKTDGTLWAWGSGTHGQLGLGDLQPRYVPVLVGTGSDWTSIASGDGHVLAIKGGVVNTWGMGFDGQLGHGGTADETAPRAMSGGYSALGGGWLHSLGIKTDGTLWAWGDNSHAQLGITGGDALSPAQVGSDTNWSVVAGGAQHSLGIKTDGTLWAWGDGADGKLGLGDTTDRAAPTRVGSDTDWATVAAGEIQSFAIKTDGTLWAWGWDYYSRLGLEGVDTGTAVLSPTQVGTDTDWLIVVTSTWQGLAIKNDGTLWAWGYNMYGELGVGDTDPRDVPVQVLP